LAPSILRPVGFIAVLMIHTAPRRLLRGAVDKRIVKDQVPDRLRKEAYHQFGQLHAKCDPRPAALLEPLVISGSAALRLDCQPGFGDKTGWGNHGSDQQFVVM
jgi:hypothetical protein